MFIYVSGLLRLKPYDDSAFDSGLELKVTTVKTKDLLKEGRGRRIIFGRVSGIHNGRKLESVAGCAQASGAAVDV